MNSQACVDLPELSGSFKLIDLSDSVVDATIGGDRIQSVRIT